MAESIGALSVTVTAIDKATGTINSVRDRLGTVAEPTRQLTAAFGRLGDATGLSRMSTHLASAAGSATALARSVAFAAVPLAAGGVAAGAVTMATNFVTTGKQLLRGARDLQMTVPQLHAFQMGAQLAGVSAEDATDGLRSFGKVLYDAVGGRNAEALGASMLSRLPLNLRNAAGGARTASEAFGDLAENVAKLNHAPREQREYARIFGVENLLPILQRGRAGVAALLREGQTRRPFTLEEAEQAKRLGDQWNSLRVDGDRLALTIGSAMAPSMERAGVAMTKWARANGEWAGTAIGERVEQVSGRVLTVGRGIDSVVKSTIGWTAATDLLTLAIGLRLMKALTGVNAATLLFAATRFPALTALAAGVGANALVDRKGLHDEARRQAQLRESGQSGWRIGGRPAGEVVGGAWQGIRSFFGLGGAGGGSGSGGRTSGGAPTAAQREAFEHFRRMGWSPEAAAGIVANGVHESGPNLDPRAVGDNGASFGTFQWNRRAGRQEAFRRWAGKDIRESTAAEQREFLNHEMTQGNDTSLRLAGQALRQATTAAEAARIMSLKNMRPAGRYGEAAARGATAEGLLPQLNRPAAPAPAPATAPPAAAPAQSPLDGPRADAGGRLSVDVRFANAPRNMVVSARPEGNVTVEPPRIETSMLGWGLA